MSGSVLTLGGGRLGAAGRRAGRGAQNGSKIRPHSALQESVAPGSQSAGHSPPAQPDLHSALDLISARWAKTVVMEHIASPCAAAGAKA